MVKVRNYRKTDYSQVASILKEVDLFDNIWDSEENLLGMANKDPESILVAEEKGTLVGNIFIIPYGKNISYLFRLAVKKAYRKQGIASTLINHAREIAKKKNISEVGLYVDSSNQELQSFYEKRGFEISKKTYYYMWTKVER